MTSEIRDCGSLHQYRTEIPNILLDSGIDPYELSFYLHLKRIAGDHGKCWASNDYLVKQTKISERKIREIKKSLVKKKLIKTFQKKKEDGSTECMVIEIINIWSLNNDFYKKENDDAPTLEWWGTICLGVGHHMPGGAAPYAPKEEPYEEEPIKKKDIVPSVSDLAQHLFFKYNEFRKSLNLEMCDKTIITKNWNNELARLLKTHSKEKLIELINFAFEDDFWKTVIESPAGLRKNIKKLETLQAQTKKSITSPNDNREYAKSIQLKFKKLEDSGRRKFQMEALTEYFEIDFLGCQAQPFTLRYDVPDFKNKLNEVLKQYNLLQ
jgi:hypothetical protein